VQKGTERYTEIHSAFLKKIEKRELTRNFAKNNKKKFEDPGSCFFNHTSSNLKKTKKGSSPVISPKSNKKNWQILGNGFFDQTTSKKS
jgi:hypothetical protein